MLIFVRLAGKNVVKILPNIVYITQKSEEKQTNTSLVFENSNLKKKKL